MTSEGDRTLADDPKAFPAASNHLRWSAQQGIVNAQMSVNCLCISSKPWYFFRKPNNLVHFVFPTLHPARTGNPAFCDSSPGLPQRCSEQRETPCAKQSTNRRELQKLTMITDCCKCSTRRTCRSPVLDDSGGRRIAGAFHVAASLPRGRPSDQVRSPHSFPSLRRFPAVGAPPGRARRPSLATRNMP